jgi:integrase
MMRVAVFRDLECVARHQRCYGRGHQLLKGSKPRLLSLAPEAVHLLDHYLRLERPNVATPPLFVSLKGCARATRMTPAGLSSLFRHHRLTTGVHSQPASLQTYLGHRHGARRRYGRRQAPLTPGRQEPIPAEMGQTITCQGWAKLDDQSGPGLMSELTDHHL